ARAIEKLRPKSNVRNFISYARSPAIIPAVQLYAQGPVRGQKLIIQQLEKRTAEKRKPSRTDIEKGGTGCPELAGQKIFFELSTSAIGYDVATVCAVRIGKGPRAGKVLVQAKLDGIGGDH